MEKFFIISNFDKLSLSCIKMVPNGDIKGVVQISHGMAECKERYIPFMEYLSNQGYVTVINDHRGHGESVREVFDYGYFYDYTGEAIVEDLYQITEYIKAEYPNVPITLFGHSMGSMVVRKYIQKHDKLIDNLIVCGSPSKNDKVELAIMLVKILQKIKGEHYRSKFINNLAFGNYNSAFNNSTSNNAWLCSREDVVKSYDEDSKCGFIFTLNGFLNLFILMRDIYDKNMYHVENHDLRCLFIAGDQDPVIINQEAWEWAQSFLKDVGYTNVNGILYPNMRHEILNEQDNDKVYQDIISFIR